MRSIKRNYNESNLVTFEDKINWLIIHDTNKLKGKCADKILLHYYSKKKIGKDICNKILKIYHSEKEIDIKELPNQFVIKTNHGSAFNIIVEDKTKLNLKNAKILLFYSSYFSSIIWEMNYFLKISLILIKLEDFIFVKINIINKNKNSYE